MKNLVLLQEYRRSCCLERRSLEEGEQGQQESERSVYVSDITIDPSAASSSSTSPPSSNNALDMPGETYLLLPSGHIVCAVHHQGKDVVIRWICDLSISSCGVGYNVVRGGWFNATFVDEIESIVCLCKDGNIVSVDPNSARYSSDPLRKNHEDDNFVACATNVGQFENGIHAASWSPDGEILVMCTHTVSDEEQQREYSTGNNSADHDEEKNGKNGNKKRNFVLIAMNAQFEVVAETPIEPIVLPSSEKNDDKVNRSFCHHEYDISVSWKPDGQSLVVSTVDSSDRIRRIRVYNRDDLRLEAVGLSEDGSGRVVKGLTSASVAWGGGLHGSLIATVLRSPSGKSTKVAFFEPNGLRHKEFDLRDISPTTDRVSDLTWNAECDILAVTVLRNEPTNYNGGAMVEKKRSSARVQLWYRNNYHWYLKYELRYENNGKKNSAACDVVVRRTKFDPEKPYRLVVALEECSSLCKPDAGATSSSSAVLPRLRWITYDFCWDVHVSSDGDATAVVIDGSTLNITPLGKVFVPPPMSAAALKLDAPVVGVCHFSRSFVGGWRKRCDAPHRIRRRRNVSMVVVLSNSTMYLLSKDTATSAAACYKDVVSPAPNSPNTMIPGYYPPLVLGKSSLSLNYMETLIDPTSLRQFIIIPAWGNNDPENHGSVEKILAVSCAETSPSCCEHLVELEVVLDPSIGEEMTVTVINKVALEGRVLRMTNWYYDENGHRDFSSAAAALVELTDGTLLEYHPGEGKRGCSILPFLSEPMMEPCPWISVLSVPAISKGEGEDHGGGGGGGCGSSATSLKALVVGLSQRSRLYCGERLLSGEASTYHLSPEHSFLSFVTLGSRPQVCFISVPNLFQWDPFAGSDQQDGLGYEPRLVERGSKLVSVLSNSPTMVLQVPRGNLETIYPRALVLPFVMKMISNKRYDEALELMNRQKVDMNVIVDWNPVVFLEDADVFVKQIGKKTDDLNSFLACLFNGDITAYKYVVPTWLSDRLQRNVSKDANRHDGNSFDFSQKVNIVCRRVREVMMEIERNGSTPDYPEGHFLLPILSSFAKQDPPQLEMALKLIRDEAISKRRRKSNMQSLSKISRSNNSLFSDKVVQHSIQYLAFLADYKVLFDTALGLYDYELTKAVARHSQMDPKVYLPRLKRLNNLPSKLAAYEVDLSLKRYELALRHLVASQEEYEKEEGENGVGDSDNAERNEDKHFDACMHLITTHKLHRLGLQLFTANENDEQETFQKKRRRRRRIMTCLGEHLLNERKNAVAALAVFLAAEPKDLNGAMKASRQCGDWRTLFSCCCEELVNAENENGDNCCEENHDEDSVRRRLWLRKKEELQRLAYEVAEDMSSSSGASTSSSDEVGRLDTLECAARILLDYGGDRLGSRLNGGNVEGAIDILLAGHRWKEGRRLALLHCLKHLERRCVESALSHATFCLKEFDERATTFEVTNKRYAVVLEIRKKAKEEGGQDACGMDDNESLYSAAASDMSDSSLRSDVSSSSYTSTSSTASSISSVISVSTRTTFSITTEIDINKHKSKYNVVGEKYKKKKKKKRKSRGKHRMKAGSQEELNDLATKLKQNCALDEYFASFEIVETILFLIHVGHLNTARQLFEGYDDWRERVETSQKERIENSQRSQKALASGDKNETRRAAALGLLKDDSTVLECEKDVDGLRCSPLPAAIHEIFSLLPP